MSCQGTRRSNVRLSLTIAALMLGLIACRAVETPYAEDGPLSPPDAPKVEVKCLRSSVPKDGKIDLDVCITNTTNKGITLAVCEEMTLCCIRGLHPIVECEATGAGVGLLDFCKAEKPTSKEVYLPSGCYFGAKFSVPLKHVPAEYLSRSENVLKLCCTLECPDGKLAHSNVVEVTVR